MSKEGSDKMKWIKRVLCLTLAFAMIITALPTTSITEKVYAKESGNGTGGGTQGAGGKGMVEQQRVNKDSGYTL